VKKIVINKAINLLKKRKWELMPENEEFDVPAEEPEPEYRARATSGNGPKRDYAITGWVSISIVNVFAGRLRPPGDCRNYGNHRVNFEVAVEQG
jgi:hypothetical protein